jgi:GTP-binding protein
MKARSAEFLISAADPAGFPDPELPEVAFAGRSNVGKSSLINAITGRKGLAKTSQTPGRTRLLNWFRVVAPAGRELAFVDLPGYGYAKVSRDMRDSWRPLIEAYLARRDVLRLVVCLIDARRGPEAEEAELLAWLAQAGLPAAAVLTKSDKLAKNKRKPTAASVQKALGLGRAPVLFSTTEELGADELWRTIDRATREP